MAAGSVGLFVLAEVDNDGLGEAILRAHAILVPEELEESKTSFKDGGAIAEGPLKRLPKPHASAGQRNDTGTSDPLAGRLSVAEEIEETPIENHDYDVARLVKVPAEMNVVFVEAVRVPDKLGGKP